MKVILFISALHLLGTLNAQVKTTLPTFTGTTVVMKICHDFTSAGASFISISDETVSFYSELLKEPVTLKKEMEGSNLKYIADYFSQLKTQGYKLIGTNTANMHGYHTQYTFNYFQKE